MRTRCLLTIALVLFSPLSVANSIEEVPYFQSLVNLKQLPPVAQRLPATPSIASFKNKTPGRYGERLRLLMGKAKDIRMVTVYGYARLVAYDETLTLKPDLLAALKNENNKRFTLTLRKGHRWSDGHPFTS